LLMIILIIHHLPFEHKKVDTFVSTFWGTDHIKVVLTIIY